MTEDDRAQLAVEWFLSNALKNHFYGYETGQQALSSCAECGNDIPEARRIAVPGVALCIECKRAEERKNKGM